MKKIIFSVLAIMLAVGAVSGAASALFSSTATISGVTFSTGNADLVVYNPGTLGWVSDWSPTTFNFNSMFPGYGGTGLSEVTSTSYQTFRLKNQSTSPISLGVVGSLRSGVTQATPDSWDMLKDQVLVAVVLPNWSAGTGWHTLNEWYTTGYTLPGGVLAQGVERDYRFYVRVSSAAGNEISTRGISDVKFDFLGTQQ